MDYVEKGSILIEGVVYSRNQEIMQEVPAKGYAMIDNVYKFEKEYFYNQIKKEYNDKKRNTFGITINSKENMLNYLNKSKQCVTMTKKRRVAHEKGVSVHLVDDSRLQSTHCDVPHAGNCAGCNGNNCTRCDEASKIHR